MASWTEAELIALKKAYASGQTEIQYEDRRVRYDSGAALLARIKYIEGEMAADAGKKKPSSRVTTFARW